jgi:large subunit ribosomal protein L25
MTMEKQTIHAQLRPEHGKGVARKLRRAGSIPAIAYGGDGEAMSLTLDPAELRQLRKSKLGWNHPVTIEVDGGTDIALALLREVQKHPISGKLLHADFLRVAPDVEVIVQVPLRAEGRAAGEEIGGRISQPYRYVELACLPAAIPETILVDVTPLEIGDKIMLSELDVPEGCRPVFRVDQTVLSCVGRRGGALGEFDVEETEDEDAEDAEDAAEE